MKLVLVVRKTGGAINLALDQQVTVNGHTFTIGRGKANDLYIEANEVSREHAALDFRDGQWRVRDLRSTNGTSVNDKPIDSSIVRNGDLLGIYHVQLEVLIGDSADAASKDDGTDERSQMDQTYSGKDRSVLG